MVIERWTPDKQAALFRTQETINQLDAFYQQYHKALYGGDVEGIIRSNRNFHYTMYEAANMPILQQVITGLWEQWAPYLYLSLGRNLALHKHDSDGSLKVHQGIMEGMKRRDSAMVRTLLKQDFAEYITLTKISLNILTDIISVI